MFPVDCVYNNKHVPLKRFIKVSKISKKYAYKEKYLKNMHNKE